MALATLGQICVRLGDLDSAESILNRAVEARRSLQIRETTGAVFDTLAQVHLIRGDYDKASDSLRQAREAYGEYGLQAGRWYEWSVRGLDAKIALRQGLHDDALRQSEEILASPGVPPGDALQAHLVAIEALLASGRSQEAESRLARLDRQLQPSQMPGMWGEFLRLRGQLRAETRRVAEAHHDLAQSISIFDLISDRYQAGLSRLALGRLAASLDAGAEAERALEEAAEIFSALGAIAKVREAREVLSSVTIVATGNERASLLSESIDLLVRRLVESAALPDLLGREAVIALRDACNGDQSVLFSHQPENPEPHVIAYVGVDETGALRLAREALRRSDRGDLRVLLEWISDSETERLGILLSAARPFEPAIVHRFRMLVSVVRQGFELCAARDRPVQIDKHVTERTLESLMPGFICDSPAMSRVVDQIQRLQSSDLTVLITGDSGTGKELVARGIYLGSRRSGSSFLPYNCTTATRELADSQLFGHRRGSFTGAMADEPGLIRSASGGTLFLDEIGDLPLDVQPKLLRFLEQSEILPIGETRPQPVDVRVLAATNADLEQRVAEGKFREDLFYRLSVIRIHVPPLRERREGIPHLATFFLRDTSEQLGNLEMQLSQDVLDLFVNYSWPGNVRQLRNEIRRAVALSPTGDAIRPEHLSPELTGATAAGEYRPARGTPRGDTKLSVAVEQLEHDLISAALRNADGNISETARSLGLTRRGLYLKLRRLGIE